MITRVGSESVRLPRTRSGTASRLWMGLALVLAVAGRIPIADAQKFSTSTGFQTQDAGSAPEGMVAVGANHVLVMTHYSNGGIRFYSKTTKALVATYNASDFFGTNGRGDPVVHYDPINARFIIVTMRLLSGHFLAVSKAGQDPTVLANWWRYQIPASVTTDYPSLGLSDDKLVITSGGFGSQRAYVLSRASAFDGTYPQYPDSIMLPPAQILAGIADGYNYKPCRNLTADATIHLAGLGLCTNPSSPCNVLVYRTITGVPSAPSVSALSTVLNTADVAPPDSPLLFGQPASAGDQRGAPAVVDDCQPKQIRTSEERLADLYMRSGKITAAWGVGRQYESGGAQFAAVHCVRFLASDLARLDDFVLGSPGVHYSYPSAIEDKGNGILVGFDRHSPGEYPSIAMIARRGSQQSAEYLVKSGTSAYTRCRAGSCPVSVWGDYTSMSLDEPGSTTTTTKGYYLGQWARSDTGATYVGLLNANYGNCSISGTVKSDVLGSIVANCPVVLTQSGVAVDSTTSDGSGNFSFGLLPTGTYILKMALDPNVALEAHEGTGAFLILAQSAYEIYIQLKNNNQCVGNEFVVAQQPIPTITAISPTSGPASAGQTLTVSGLDLRAWSVIRIDERVKATTFNAGTLTASLSADDVARYGPHWITAYTPGAPNGGLSNRVMYAAIGSFLPATTLPAAVTTCPAGDFGHLTASATLQTGACVNATVDSVQLAVKMGSGAGLAIWQGATVDPFDTARLIVRGTATNGPGPNQRTFAFDVAKMSGCGTVEAYFEVVRASGAKLVNRIPDFDLKSYDLEYSVHGAVDHFDVERLGQLLGTGPGCGDFNRSNFTDASDASAQAAHLGHRAQEMRLIAPNGGENIDRLVFGGTIPFTIQWVHGAGPEAKVTINLLDGASSTNIITNTPDDGEYEWYDYCGVPASANKKVEVIYTAGDKPTGTPPPGYILGSDQSDNPFQISRECPEGLIAGRGDRLPRALELGAPHPNPTATEVGMSYALPKPAHVRIIVFDAAGRVVRRLVDETRVAGVFEAHWDLRGGDGAATAPGLYFVRMQVSGWRQERKVVVGR
jgi:hypothetical protein